MPVVRPLQSVSVGSVAEIRLTGLIATLEHFHGKPRSRAPKDPFELLMWEYVGYLADDDTRAGAYAELNDRVGLKPAEIAAAPLPVLSGIARLGGAIAVSQRASRMRDAATTVCSKWNGRLRDVLRLPYAEARKALKSFPSIGLPGADKILLLSGARPVLALDSNALRVLLRVGYGRESENYAKSYAAAQSAAMDELPKTIPALTRAFVVLQHHGRTLCRRNHPSCPDCPVRASCAFGRKVR
jgi:endonuclease III